MTKNTADLQQNYNRDYDAQIEQQFKLNCQFTRALVNHIKVKILIKSLTLKLKQTKTKLKYFYKKPKFTRLLHNQPNPPQFLIDAIAAPLLHNITSTDPLIQLESRGVTMRQVYSKYHGPAPAVPQCPCRDQLFLAVRKSGPPK